MGKISNTLTMMQLLNTGRKYGVDELATILEITPRMVRVYKDELEKAGIYIDTIRGPYGGYVLKQNIKIPHQRFSNDDINLLNKLYESTKEKSLKEELSILTDKVQGIYQERECKATSLNLKDEILLKYNIMVRAIKEQRKVKISYFSYNKGETKRIIHPAEMFLYDDGWFVAAFCEYKNDIRHFELKRISEYELLEEQF